jgi:hypothetical protein
MILLNWWEIINRLVDWHRLPSNETTDQYKSIPRSIWGRTKIGIKSNCSQLVFWPFGLCPWPAGSSTTCSSLLWGVSENSDGIPEHRSTDSTNVQVWSTVYESGDRESPKDWSRLKSCESLYTCPHAPFYRETKGLLHFENTLESKEYSQCEHVHKCLLHPVICGADFIHLQTCH